MFGRKKEAEPEGPYRVDSVVGKGRLQRLLNERDAEGYDLVAILQNEAFGSNSSRDVVFKLRA